MFFIVSNMLILMLSTPIPPPDTKTSLTYKDTRQFTHVMDLRGTSPSLRRRRLRNRPNCPAYSCSQLAFRSHCSP